MKHGFKCEIWKVICSNRTSRDWHKSRFYAEPRKAVNGVIRNIAIVMGDIEERVGPENLDIEHIIGKRGIGKENENGELFKEFCESSGPQEHYSHLGNTKTFLGATDHTTHNKVDHFVITRSGDWESCCQPA